MKHWGKPLPKGSKFPPGIGKTIFPQERGELDRQGAAKRALYKHLNLPKMPTGDNGAGATISTK